MKIFYLSATVFQVLTNPNGAKLSWIPGFNGFVPLPLDKAVKSDDDSPNPYYIGRIQKWSSLIVGNVFPNTKLFCYPTELRLAFIGFWYSVLVQNE